MKSDRRTFLKQARLGLATTGGAGTSPPWQAEPIEAQTQDPCDALPKQGPEPVVRGKRAVCSSQGPIVTPTMLDVMKADGNAIDATVAGCIVLATVGASP